MFNSSLSSGRWSMEPVASAILLRSETRSNVAIDKTKELQARLRNNNEETDVSVSNHFPLPLPPLPPRPPLPPLPPPMDKAPLPPVRFLIAFLELTMSSDAPAVGASSDTLVLLFVCVAPILVRISIALERSVEVETSFASN